MLFRGLSASRGYKTHTYLGLEIQSALSLALWSSAQSFWLQIEVPGSIPGTARFF